MITRSAIALATVLSLVGLPAKAQSTTQDEKNGHHYSGGPKTEVPHHMGPKEAGDAKQKSGGSHHYSGGPKTEVPHHMGPKKE